MALPILAGMWNVDEDLRVWPRAKETSFGEVSVGIFRVVAVFVHPVGITIIIRDEFLDDAVFAKVTMNEPMLTTVRVSMSFFGNDNKCALVLGKPNYSNVVGG